MMHGALEVVGHALFGTDLSADADRLARATLSALDVVVARARVPITPPAWVPSPANRKLQAAVRELDGAVQRMLDERRRGRDGAPADMLDLLIDSRDDTGAGLGVEEIRNQVVTFIVAGHETVASALTWAWALLAEHPDIQAELQAESDAVLGGRPATFADYARLPFARAVLDEALRLYPPAWLITRKSLDHDVLGGHDIPELSPGHPQSVAAASSSGRLAATRSSSDRIGSSPARPTAPRSSRSGRACDSASAATSPTSKACSCLRRSPAATRWPTRTGAGVPRSEPLVTVRPVGGLPLAGDPPLTRRRLPVGSSDVATPGAGKPATSDEASGC